MTGDMSRSARRYDCTLWQALK